MQNFYADSFQKYDEALWVAFHLWTWHSIKAEVIALPEYEFGEWRVKARSSDLTSATLKMHMDGLRVQYPRRQVV